MFCVPTTVNLFLPNTVLALNLGVPKYIKQVLADLKGETGKHTIVVGDFYTPLTAMDRSFRKSRKYWDITH